MQNELNTHCDGYVQRFEDILEQVATLNDPTCIAQLLLLFNDDEKYDEIMFAIIHTIERFDDATYIRSIVEHLESFFTATPRWAIIVQMRILNSPPTLAAYSDCVRSLPHDVRAVIRKVLENVQKKNSKFNSHCNSLLAVIRPGRKFGDTELD